MLTASGVSQRDEYLWDDYYYCFLLNSLVKNASLLEDAIECGSLQKIKGTELKSAPQ